jgi:hypothetical protein
MRIIIFILILVVVALLIAVASGLISITQTRPGQAPEVRVGNGGVQAVGGQAPAFDVETGTVSVGTSQRQVPTVQVRPADRNGPQNAVDNAAQPE